LSKGENNKKPQKTCKKRTPIVYFKYKKLQPSFLIFIYMENLLDKKTLAEIEKHLLAQQKQILGSLEDISRDDNHEADNTVAKFPEYGNKPDENAQEISDYSSDVVTEKVLEKSLEDIKNALKRIEKGTYGVCKYCGNPIGKRRLLARPTASSCIKCKTELQENE